MNTRENTTIRHLECNTIVTIGLHLNENVYGANGELSEEEIRARLIEDIRMATDQWASDAIPVWAVANLLMHLWEYKDREFMDQLVANATAGCG